MPSEFDVSLIDGTLHDTDILIRNYLRILGFSFLFYDHLITFGDEIEYMWSRPKMQSVYLFLVSRYFAFFSNIVAAVVEFTTLHTQSCRQYALFRQVTLLVIQLQVCFLLTLRVYALYGCSVRVLIFMVGCGTILLSISIWSLFGQKVALVQNDPGCPVGYSRVTAIRLATAWGAIFVFDLVIFCLTMAKTWKGRHDHGTTRTSVPIVRLVFRDGAIYFAIIAVANLANIATYYFCGPVMKGSLSTFASCISVTMVSRLMLNLHEFTDIGIYSTAVPFTNTNVEYTSPSGAVELDTLYSGDLRHKITT